MKYSKCFRFFGSLLTILFSFNPSFSQPKLPAENIQIFINANQEMGKLDPIWAWWGYDEPNYTYMKDGEKLLSEISQLSKVPVFVRAHSLLVTGEGTHALKWGSTNAYTEDKEGNPIYDWHIIDKIFDTYIERGMKPMAQIGFMPEALSSKPIPYRHFWKPGAKYEEIYTGWAYPPKDYEKWAELVYQWVKHSIDRYGKEEVESWYWELWNEPNIGYWQGTTEEYIKLYDYTADAVKRALPSAKMGGPEVTGPAWEVSEKFLKTFLDHIKAGKNYATGEIGAPLDFISFHAKGGPKIVNNRVRMDMGTQLRDINRGFEIVASYPEFKHLPIIIGESDPEGCAACSEADYPHNAYRNGTMYAAYTASVFARKYDLAKYHGVNLLGAVTWGFEFENQPWFAGFRDMATNGVDKPVLNVFRMFGMMENERIKVDQSNLAYDFIKIRDQSVRGELADINALASKGKNAVTVMLWNYHDDNNLEVEDANVSLNIAGLPNQNLKLEHFRIDQENSNSYTKWKEMGSPQNPTDEQIRELEKSGQLVQLVNPGNLTIKDGKAEINLTMPRQAISFLKISWGKPISLKTVSSFPIGTAINLNSTLRDSKKLEITKNEFNSLSAENDMKMYRVMPQEGEFQWDRVDNLVGFAQENNMRLFGHALIWHSGTPNWVKEKLKSNPEWAKGFIEDYIKEYVGKYKGKVAGWDVVNEAIETSGGEYRKTEWYNALGMDYIKIAFQAAHEADPNADLFINDFNLERDTLKLNALLNLVDNMKKHGVPITGIGFQMHYRMDISDEMIEFTLKKAAATGLKIHLSEVDLIFNKHNDSAAEGIQKYTEYTEKMAKQQADKYANLIRIYYKTVPKSQRFGITFWGFNDRDSWIKPFFKIHDWPTIFDENLNPKKAYYSILKELK